MPEVREPCKTYPGQATAATPDWTAEKFSLISVYRKEEVRYIVASPIAGFEMPERHSGNGSCPALMDT
jgi:hypothetical protein